MDYETFDLSAVASPEDWDEFLDEMLAAEWEKMFSEGWDIFPDSEEVDEQCLSIS